jgi:hypothetical protein
VYPLKIGSFDIRHFLVRSNRVRLEEKLRAGKWIPAESEMPYNFKIKGVEPRYCNCVHIEYLYNEKDCTIILYKIMGLLY